MSTIVEDNTARCRYELYVDDRLAGYADYRVDGVKMVFPHTEIVPKMRNQGLAAILIGHALDDVARSGRTVIPICSYVAHFIDEHPEYQELLDPTGTS